MNADAAARHARQSTGVVAGKRRRRASSGNQRPFVPHHRHQDVGRPAAGRAALRGWRQAPFCERNRGRAAPRRDRSGRAQQQGHAGDPAGWFDDRRGAAPRGSAGRDRVAANGPANAGTTDARRRRCRTPMSFNDVVAALGESPSIRHQQRAAHRAADAVVSAGALHAHPRQPRHAPAQARWRRIRRDRSRGGRPAAARHGVAHFGQGALVGLRARARAGHRRHRDPREAMRE